MVYFWLLYIQPHTGVYTTLVRKIILLLCLLIARTKCLILSVQVSTLHHSSSVHLSGWYSAVVLCDCRILWWTEGNGDEGKMVTTCQTTGQRRAPPTPLWITSLTLIVTMVTGRVIDMIQTLILVWKEAKKYMGKCVCVCVFVYVHVCICMHSHL